MEKANPIRDKSYTFALAAVVFCKENLIARKKEYIISKQLIRSATSVGSNIEEGIHAPSKSDFARMLSIALKEAYESRYWLRILCDAKYVIESEITDLLKQVTEIIALLTTILKTARASIK